MSTIRRGSPQIKSFASFMICSMIHPFWQFLRPDCRSTGSLVHLYGKDSEKRTGKSFRKIDNMVYYFNESE